MARRTMHARITCPGCQKKNVMISIKVSEGSSGVDATIGKHQGLFEGVDCPKSRKLLPNKDIPPMSEWY